MSDEPGDSRRSWGAYDDAPSTDPDEAESAVEDIQRRLCRDRMLGLWRGAVDCVADVVKAEHGRDHVERPRPAAAWRVRRANSDNAN